MQIAINIPDAPINDYLDLYYKIHGMAASEGLFDDKKKSQRALALKVVLDVLEGVVKGTPLPEGHRFIDADEILNHAFIRDDEEGDIFVQKYYCIKKEIVDNALVLFDTLEEDKGGERMTRGTVIEHFLRNWDYAQRTTYIRKPFSWALYQTWKWVDEREEERKVVEDGND